MKEQINEQLALLEKELSRLKKVTDYIDDTKKTAQVVISELKEVQDNYSAYTEKIFDLYKTSVEQLKKETELQIKEGVIHFETTGSEINKSNIELSNTISSDLNKVKNSHTTHTEKIFELYKSSLAELRKETELLIKKGIVSFETTGLQIDRSNKKLSNTIASDLEEVRISHTNHTEKIFELYKSSLVELRKETELLIKEGVVSFETTGSKIDQTNREKLVETKRLLENYRKTVEATDNLVKTLKAVDFPTRLDIIEENISKNLEEFSQRFNIQDKQNKIIKILLFVILGLIGIGGIGAIAILMVMKII